MIAGVTRKLKRLSLKVTKLPFRVVMLFSGSTSRHPSDSADPGQQDRFDEETEQDASLRETREREGSDFPRAAGHGRIHSIHRGETTADGHDDSDKSPKKARGSAETICAS